MLADEPGQSIAWRSMAVTSTLRAKWYSKQHPRPRNDGHRAAGIRMGKWANLWETIDRAEIQSKR